jgi:hypothetical protein
VCHYLFTRKYWKFLQRKLIDSDSNLQLFNSRQDLTLGQYKFLAFVTEICPHSLWYFEEIVLGSILNGRSLLIIGFQWKIIYCVVINLESPKYFSRLLWLVPSGSNLRFVYRAAVKSDAPMPCSTTYHVQVNLCQKHLFSHQLIHNMTKDCSLIYKFSTWKLKAQNMLCTKIVLNVKTKTKNNLCTQHVLSL